MKILGKIRELIQLKEERNKYKEIARKQSILLERIVDTCIEYQQLNCSMSYSGFNKIRTLARSDLNKDYRNQEFLQDDNEDFCDYMITTNYDINDSFPE
jgi:hypothetical protein